MTELAKRASGQGHCEDEILQSIESHMGIDRKDPWAETKSTCVKRMWWVRVCRRFCCKGRYLVHFCSKQANNLDLDRNLKPLGGYNQDGI